MTSLFLFKWDQHNKVHIHGFNSDTTVSVPTALKNSLLAFPLLTMRFSKPFFGVLIAHPNYINH